MAFEAVVSHPRYVAAMQALAGFSDSAQEVEALARKEPSQVKASNVTQEPLHRTIQLQVL